MLLFLTSFVQSAFSELYVTEVTWLPIKTHPPPSSLVLHVAGPTLWNFKMIPCLKCRPVGQN